jgi:N-acetylneuraminate epimerase
MKIYGQAKPVWTALPSLPDKEGFAGMFAGVSNGVLFCMGGANFPDKRPWEGGIKKWYDGIFMLEGKQWVLLPEKLFMPMGYGVSISYQQSMIIIGGSSGKKHSRKVMSYTWSKGKLSDREFPNLPLPLANMTGCLVGDIIIIAGGSNSPDGPPLKKCFGLDLTSVDKGWFEFPEWPGHERTQPVCATYDGKFYLFSGESPGMSNANEKYRNILQDAYSFLPVKSGDTWEGEWTKLSPMPKGASAAGFPLPVMPGGNVLFWGGVDAVTAAYKDQATHPGIMKELLFYNTMSDTWNYTGNINDTPARVTLPVVYFNGSWIYINGEVKPGIRTNTVYSVKQ